MASGEYARKVAYLVENDPAASPNIKSYIEKIVKSDGWSTVRSIASNENGNLVSPEVAAKRIIGVLGHTRTVSGSRNESEPLGELISLNVELVGLRGQPVFLSWSIFPTGGHNNMFGKWVNNFVAYRLVATTDDDTGSLDIWIPLPKVTGPYFTRLNLTTGGANLASTDSGPFG